MKHYLVDTNVIIKVFTSIGEEDIKVLLYLSK